MHYLTKAASLTGRYDTAIVREVFAIRLTNLADLMRMAHPVASLARHVHWANYFTSDAQVVLYDVFYVLDATFRSLTSTQRTNRNVAGDREA